MFIKMHKKLCIGIIIFVGVIWIVSVKSLSLGKTIEKKTLQFAEVKAMKVIQRDTPINYEFVGKITAENEIKIMSKISGNIVGKMVKGGDTVYKGQPLFKVDNKQYMSAINNAKATLGKSEATYNNSKREVERYGKLLSAGAISQETFEAYESQAEENYATMEANRSALQQAIEDEQDTLITSPVDGRIDLNDLSLGAYVAASSTTLATVSSVNPILAQFNISENEYIKLSRQGQGDLANVFNGNTLRLILSDGSEYPLMGQLEQIDRGISDTTGTITVKASFWNPDKFLAPGMFAKVIVPGEVYKGALLIPQRAVKEMLDATFVTVVTDNNKAESRQVKMGEKFGDLWMVEDGLKANEIIVVEGIDKVKQGAELQITMMTSAELENSAE